MTILAPIILFFLFAFGFPLDAKHIPLGVVDFDKTALSRDLIDAFESATDLFNVKKVVSNYPAAEDGLDLGNLRTVLVIPSNFDKDLKAARPVTLQVLIDGTYPNRANLISAYTGAVIASFRMILLGEYFLKNFGYSGTSDLPIDLTVSGWYNPSFRSEDFIVPGTIAMVMMFFPPLVSALSLAKEKETGSILNMYCSSINKAEYLLGKMTPYVIISYINFVLFLLATIYIFKVPMRGSTLILMVVSFFYVASTIAMGLLVAVLVNTQVAAILITSVVTLTPTFLYSGFMVPLSSIGRQGRVMAYCFPATYYIDIARKIMVKGASFIYVKADFFILIAFCVGFYVLCIKLFKKRLG